MENKLSTRPGTATVLTAFVTEQENAKLAQMLTLVVDDLERVSGGTAVPVYSTCCHAGSPQCKA